MEQDLLHGDGNWRRAPWFLEPEAEGWHEDWDAVGLTREKRELAADALDRIFSRQQCLLLRNDPAKRYSPAMHLFGLIRTPGLVAHLLHLGVDAVRAEPWNHRMLLEALRRRQSHFDAAFEVQVHAGLLRAGYQVERIPEKPSHRTADLRVEHRGTTYELEIKRVNSPESDELARQLEHALFTTVGADLCIPGFDVTIEGSDALRERALEAPAEVKEEMPQIIRALYQAGQRLLKGPAPGVYQVEGYGFLRVSRSETPHGQAINTLLTGHSEDKKARRVLRLVRKALEQLSGAHRGVLAIGVYHSASLQLVERMILEAAARDDLFKKAIMIVLCDAFPQEGIGHCGLARTPAFRAISPRSYWRPSKRELELARAIASTHWRTAAQVVDVPRPGAWLVKQDTRPRTSTLVGLGGLSGPLPAGTSLNVTLSKNGITSEVVPPPAAEPSAATSTT